LLLLLSLLLVGRRVGVCEAFIELAAVSLALSLSLSIHMTTSGCNLLAPLNRLTAVCWIGCARVADNKIARYIVDTTKYF
jgi:hypothetical protein